ncbi:hypothetical protein ACROYT_G019912 [Oculina patagonica]
MASCDKNRLSSVQQNSKIPVRKATCLSSGSGKTSSSKDEANKKQRILRDSAERLQNKRPSRIPILVGRTNSKNDKDKRFKNIISSTTKKDSGVSLSETLGKRATRVKTTVHTPAKNAKKVKEPTRPLGRRLPATPLNAKQTSREDASRDYAHLREEIELLKGSLDLSNHREELLRRQVDDLEKELFDCKNSEQAFKSDVKTELQGSNGVCTSCEEGYKMKLERLEKEHSEIVEELQQWVEDGYQENKTLKEVIEKTNEENAKLLVQISVMKNEMKTLEKTPKMQQLEKEHSQIVEELQQWVEDGDQENKTLREIIEKNNEENAKLLVQISVMKNEMKNLQKKNDTLQNELETKRVDLKRLKVNAYFNERELRNLKRDLKKKEQKLEGVEERMDKALMEKQKLLCHVDYLEGSFKESQASNEGLNAKVDELKEMVQELNMKGDEGRVPKEVQLSLKGSLEMSEHREKLLRFQVNALEAEASHFKTREFYYKEKLFEMNKLNDDKSEVISHLEDQLATFIKDNARIVRIISERDEELAELQEEKLKLQAQLEFQLTTLMNENDRIENQFENELAKLKNEHSTMKTETEVSDKDKRLAKLQEQVETLKEQNNLTRSELDMAYSSLTYTDDKIEKLIKELERESFNKDVLSMALAFSLDNCDMKERIHARETRNLKNELAEMKSQTEMAQTTLAKKGRETLTFLVNENQVCMQLNGEKFFAM